jgi:hypothetical protein
MKNLCALTVLATSIAVFLCGSDAQARSDYWNNSGFSVSHDFFPIRRPAYFSYAPTIRYYIVRGRRNRRDEPDKMDNRPADNGPAESQPAPTDWAKKCHSSCQDLSGDR